jgi:hypothetical protein
MHNNHPRRTGVIGPLEHNLQTELDVAGIIARTDHLPEGITAIETVGDIAASIIFD